MTVLVTSVSCSSVWGYVRCSVV